MKITALALLSLLTGVAVAQPAPQLGISDPRNHRDPDDKGWTFQPDSMPDQFSVYGWKRLGSAKWTPDGSKIAPSDEIVGDAKDGAGLLLLGRSFQDVAIHTLFKNSGSGEVGFAFRLEPTPTGMKGILVSIKDKEIGSYRIVLDKDGKEVEREPLQAAGSIVRLAPKADPNVPAAGRRGAGGRGANGGRRGGAAGAARGPETPISRPDTSIRPGEWNQLEVFLDLNIIRSFVNDGGETAGGAAEESMGRYGQVALYAGAGAELHLKNFGFKDLAVRSNPPEVVSDHFRMQRLNDMYYSWGCAAGDFNKDGNLDIVSGPYIYFGPDFKTYSEVYPAVSFNPTREFTDVNCQYVFDFNGDGWPDILTGPPRATIYLNPKGESRRWDKFEIIPSVQTEVTVFRDIDGSGVPALIYGADGSMRYAKPDMKDPTKPWVPHMISERGLMLGHGIGVGDINGDGRMDVVNGNGWWEQPAEGPDKGPWKYHPQAFGRFGHRSTTAGGAVMAVYDVNGDGLADVVTALNAHGFGLAWYEQKRNAAGEISFVEHIICDDYSFPDNAGGVTFSEPHGSTFADVDGDGVLDFIVGKRYWSHLDDYFDPDPYGPPVLYVYRTVRDKSAPGGAKFVPELVHNRSGAGSDVLAVDLLKTGKIDIVTATDRGTFIFWNKGDWKAASPAPAPKQ